MLKLISAFIQSRQLDCEWKLGEALMLSLLISMAGCLVGFMLLVALYFQPLIMIGLVCVIAAVFTFGFTHKKP